MSKHNTAGCSFIAGCVGSGIVISLLIFGKPGAQTNSTTSEVSTALISNSSANSMIEQTSEEAVQPPTYLHGPDFSDYPAGSYDGSVTRPDFKGPQRAFRSYRTKISEAVDEGPTFAGSVAIASFGCGTDCSMGYAINLTDGSIVPLPVGGEPNPGLSLDFRQDSRLLKTAWRPNLQNEACVAEAYYEWNGSGFSQVSSNIPDCGEGGT